MLRRHLPAPTFPRVVSRRTFVRRLIAGSNALRRVLVPAAVVAARLNVVPAATAGTDVTEALKASAVMTSIATLPTNPTSTKRASRTPIQVVVTLRPPRRRAALLAHRRTPRPTPIRPSATLP